MFLSSAAVGHLPVEPRCLLADAEDLLYAHPDVEVIDGKTYADGDTLYQRAFHATVGVIGRLSVIDEHRTDPDVRYPDEETRLAVSYRRGATYTRLSVEEVVGHPEHGTGPFVHIVEQGVDGQERQTRAPLEALTDATPALERTARFLAGVLHRVVSASEAPFVSRVDELTERCLVVGAPESAMALEVGWQSLPLDDSDPDVSFDQDAALIDKELGLFGVFDGMGSNRNSGLAARLSAVVAHEDLRSKAGQLMTAEDRREAVAVALHEAHVSIMEHKEMGIKVGCTTGTVALVGEEDIAWASAGDTRLTALYDDGTIEHVSSDEVDPDPAKRYLVTNILGMHSTHVMQSGVLPRVRADGAKVVRIGLMTDGVTGDAPEEQWSDAAMIAALSNRPAEAARRLVEDSTKIDDKFAIVVGL